MALAAGSRIGAYEIGGLLGAGGMGEVYRARDTRLGRDVAVKVLPPVYAADAERVHRFEQEARATSQLNHPNILTVFDVGTEAGLFYLVTELLEGETLRERLASAALPVRKAVDLSAQVADAVAAAHEKGITHRDLKPENIFVTREGRAKVLDFGLAKLREAEVAGSGGDAPTIAHRTDAGLVLGTVGYMSPEQVRGKPADARSDIFALGTVLYEMLSGRRAFQRDSAAETMTAIVREDPPSLDKSGVTAPPALERIIQHCLEKNPDERFQSARDLAFDLRALSELSSSAAREAIAEPRRLLAVPGLAIAIIGAVVALAIAYYAGFRTAAAPPPWFDRLTFRQGEITSARFAAGGSTVAYSATWGSAPEQIFVGQPGSAEFRPLDVPDARLLSISPKGELAVMLKPRFQGGFIFTGTLARVPAGGGAPRELLEDVEWAEWGPDGESLAVVRTVSGHDRLEFPIGTLLFDTAGWITEPRLAASGDAIAFLHHPVRGNDAGEVMVVDRAGHATSLSRRWLSTRGLSWAGDEILFTASASGNTLQLYGVSRRGKQRLVASGMGSMQVFDRAADGRLLLERRSARVGIAVRTPSDKQDREMSWLDWTLLRDLSDDGTMMTFDETGEGGGPHSSVYLRRTDGSPAIRLGDGVWPMLSRDGKWIACIQGDPASVDPSSVVILPTGAGESRRIATPGISPLSARWFPDGRRLLVGGNEPGHALRYYVVPLDGGAPRAVTPEGSAPFVREVSPDGRYVLTSAPGGYKLFAVDGGPAQPVQGLEPGDRIAGMATNDSAYAYAGSLTVVKVDLKSGARQPMITISRPGETGAPFGVRMTPDGRTYAYVYSQVSSELFLMRRSTR